MTGIFCVCFDPIIKKSPTKTHQQTDEILYESIHFSVIVKIEAILVANVMVQHTEVIAVGT